MSKYYHFTSLYNLNSIINEGLKPNNGFRCQTINDSRYGIFLSKGIDYSIIMFAFMFAYFEKYMGQEGDKEIEKSLYIIRDKYDLMNQTNSPRIISNCKAEMDYNNNIIRKIVQLKNCGNFFNYIGGLGCYLSIDGLNDINEDNPSDCCYQNDISPSNINMVCIKNKFTGEYINSVFAVVSYFMSLYPREQILKIVPDENKKDIDKLYNYKEQYGWNIYNSCNFDLVELPINDYNKQKH